MISRRKALKPYVCTYSCGGWIKSGSVYLRHALKEKTRGVGGTTCEKITTMKECSGCATRSGRAGLLETPEKA
jgi:hypothetical protein